MSDGSDSSLQAHHRARLLFDMAKLDMETIRHLESQRERQVALTAVLATALFAFAGMDRVIAKIDAIPFVLAALVALTCWLLSLEQFTKMQQAWRTYLDRCGELSPLLGSAAVSAMVKRSTCALPREPAYQWMSDRKSHALLNIFPVAILTAGILLGVSALFSNSTSVGA